MRKAMAVVVILASMLVPSLTATAQEAGDLHQKLLNSVVFNRSDEVKALIKAGVDVNKRFDLGASRNITPLYLAVLLGNADVARTLVDLGADVRADFEGMNLLHVAALYGGNKAVIELLIANGLDVDAKCTVSGEAKDATPLLVAAGKGNKEVTETLIKNKADVNVKLPSSGYTPLHWAASGGHKEVTEVLIANGADVNAMSRYGETPLDLARSKGHKDLADLLATIGNAHQTTAKPPPVQSFTAGGIPIAIPPPTTEMTEVGYDHRAIIEIFVPANNRLIAGFVLTQDLPKITQKSDGLVMAQYALVEVPRRGEYMDCSASDFSKVTAGAREKFGDLISLSTKEVEEEFNRRLKSLDLNELKVGFGKTVQLGCLFSKQDAYGFGMITPVSIGGTTSKMGLGAAIVRAKQRLLFVYLYAEYKSEDTVRWLRKATEDWADAILKANK